MNDQVTKPRRGCLFYGCLTSIFLLVVVLTAALLGLSYAKRAFASFTETKPLTLPSVQMEPAQVDQVRQRFSTFQDAIARNQPTQPLVLTSDEINVLIAHQPDFAALKNKLFVSIEGDRLKGQVSVPMAELGLALFRDRYLNGTATFGVSLQNGALVINAQDVVVKGKPLPGVYLNKIRQQNLAQGVGGGSGTSAALQQIQDIQIKDGKLIVTPKLGLER